jgi:hypothetical protein
MQRKITCGYNRLQIDGNRHLLQLWRRVWTLRLLPVEILPLNDSSIGKNEIQAPAVGDEYGLERRG